jgi:hypothetical protein
MQNDTISFLHFQSFKKFPGLGGSGAGGVGKWTDLGPFPTSCQLHPFIFFK